MPLFAITGEFDAPELDGADINVMLGSIEEALAREGAVGAHRVGSSISFRGTWVGPTIRALYAHGRSAIEVVPGDPTRVRYRFSQIPSAVVLAVVVVALVGFSSGQLGHFDIGALLFFAVGIGGFGLLGGQIGAQRLRHLVRRVVGLPLS